MASQDSLSDEGLMARVRDGSVAAFETLYERHHRALFTFLFRLLADRAMAEDLLQEAFLRVYLHRETYQPRATFRTWLFTIARHLALDHFRRGVKVEGEDRLDLLTVEDPSPASLHLIETADLVSRLEGALSRLPHGQREILLLSRFAGLSHSEIAEVVGANPTAVRVTLHRALRSLRRLVESGE